MLCRRATDDEFIERTRRGLATSGRWRPWLTLLYAVLMIAVVAFAGRLLEWAIRIAALPAGPAPANAGRVGFGFLIGAITGFTAAGLVAKVLKEWLNLVFGMRAERLLIPYHDLYRDAATDAPRSAVRETSQDGFDR